MVRVQFRGRRHDSWHQSRCHDQPPRAQHRESWHQPLASAMSPATPTLTSNLGTIAYGAKTYHLGAVGHDVELRVQRWVFYARGINVKF